MDWPWHIDLFGGLRAARGEQRVTHFRRHTAAVLLAYLAYAPQRLHPREALIEMLWPGCDPTVGRDRLSTDLSWLRRQFESPGSPVLFRADRAAIGLNPAAVTTDVGEFEAALRCAARANEEPEREWRLCDAIERYAGELLPGYAEEWALREREHLAERYQQALAQLIRRREERGDKGAAIEMSRRAVSADPLREDAQHTLIRLLAADGRHDAARRHYRQWEQLLTRELGCAPAPETRDLVAALPAPAAGRSRRLPLPLTRFFGREAEVAHLRERLSGGETRLVTLTGVGGSGKTRLALAVAEELVEPLQGAVWFVPLAEVADARALLDAVVAALELPRTEEIDPLGAVVTALADQPALLVLDNFEGVTDAGASVVRALLSRVPSLTCLVTSRKRLCLAGEREFSVMPLPVSASLAALGSAIDRAERGSEHTLGGLDGAGRNPEPRAQSLERLLAFPSVQLFVDRAQAVRPDFRLAPGDAAVMAELCRRLEGLPLAIELAAARTRILSLAELLAQLRRPLDVLVSRERDACPRHRSLRAMLQWSYDLLTPDLQRFFAGLSVFRGGWTREAAKAIADCGSGEQAVLDLLEQLHDASLIIVEDSRSAIPEMRFRMLETMREFAGEQLTAEEAAELSRRHAQVYLALAEASESHLFGGGEQTVWLERLEREHDNLRAALAWCKDAPEGEVGLRLAGALARFWDLRGYWTEGRAHLAAVLEALGEPTPLRARVLSGAGTLAFRLADHPAARAWHEESLAIYQALGDRRGAGACLTHLGNLAWAEGDTLSARAFHQESRTLAREIDDRHGIAASLHTLGSMARYEGEPRLARDLLCESLAIRRGLGDGEGIADSLLQLCLVAESERRVPEARALCEESLATYRELGHKRGFAHALAILSVLARQEGDHSAAQRLTEESLLLQRELGDRQGLGYSLRQLAFLAHARGDLATSRRRSEESLAVWREIGSKREALHQLGNLGHLARQEGDYPRALACYRQSLVLRLEMDEPLLIAMALEDLATVAARQGKHERVARLLGAAEALVEPLGKSLPIVGGEYFEPVQSLARAALGEAAFAQAWAEGRAMSRPGMIAYAMADAVGRSWVGLSP